MVVYVSSGYGVEKCKLLGKPFEINLSGTDKPLFIESRRVLSDGTLSGLPRRRRLRDMGVVTNNYNNWKTFRKLKQAEEWHKRCTSQVKLKPFEGYYFD